MYEVPLTNELIIIIIPMIVLQLFLTIYSIYDWIKQGPGLNSRYVWLIVIIAGNVFGSVIYLLVAPRDSVDF